MRAQILERPSSFGRVDLVKRAVEQPVLPGDDRLWILGGHLVFCVDDVVHEVPHGFTTDGASVPDWAARVTRWHRWDEPQRWAGIVHDWLYCQHGVRRRWCDQVFAAILASEHAHWVTQRVMYWAVRVGGWPAFTHDQVQGPRLFP